MNRTLVNGQYKDTISTLDRGLQYGDGLFETIAVAGDRLYLWDAHLARLTVGCKRLNIPTPNCNLLATEADMLITGCIQGVLKILVTRGDGGRGYKPPTNPQPTRILSLHPKPEYPARWWHEGVRVRLCQTRLNTNPILAGIKHNNRLEQILARSEWDDPDITEGLMQDQADNWISGTHTNLMLVNNTTIHTPKLDNCGIAGVMRDAVLKRARYDSMTIVEGSIKTQDLIQAQGIYLTNSLLGILPVKELAGHTYNPETLPIRLRSTWLYNIAYPNASANGLQATNMHS